MSRIFRYEEDKQDLIEQLQALWDKTENVLYNHFDIDKMDRKTASHLTMKIRDELYMLIDDLKEED